jgi:hypothetical protein
MSRVELSLEGELIASVPEWLERLLTPPKGGARTRSSERALARSWQGEEALGLKAPAELLALLDSGPSEGAPCFPEMRLVRGEVRVPLPRHRGANRLPFFLADQVLEGEDGEGPVLVVVMAQGEEPCGERVENLLVASARRVAEEQDCEGVEEIRTLARVLFSPWREGLPLLGSLRYPHLAAAAGAMALAEERGIRRVGLVVHEIVELARTREARRRSNREDLDHFVRRLTGGEVERLRRGVLEGPVRMPGGGESELYLGKVRRDL